MFALLALVLGAIGGFVTGQNIGSEKDEVGSSSKGQSAGPAKAKQGSRHESATVRETKRAKRPLSISQISGTPGSTQRVQAMLDFYADLSPSQFEREAGKLDQLPMNERLLASFLLFGRWAELDPTAAMG